MRDVGKDSFVRSLEIRRDKVYSRILQEMSTMDNFISRKIKVVYHRNCYRKYTSKQNCSVDRSDKFLQVLNREPVHHHFESMRTLSTCSHVHWMQLYVL
jgi:hypothetical protein